MRVLALVLAAALAGGCVVSERYVVAPETLTAMRALPAEARARTAAPAQREKNGRPADVRVSALALSEAAPRPDGQVRVESRFPLTGRMKLGHALMWPGTAASIAGLLMVILGRDAVRWSGIALSCVAEPLMISGTVLVVRGARAHPQELPRGLADVIYLPPPGAPPASLPAP